MDERLRQQTFGHRFNELDDYCTAVEKKGRFLAVAVYLENERWLDDLITPQPRSRGDSWIVLAVESPAVPPRPRRAPRTITPSIRFEVFRRDSFTCQYCGRRASKVILHVDHVVPVVAGTNELANLRTACSLCNVGKGGRRLVIC